LTDPEQRGADAAAYWIEQLDAGHALVERVLAHPVEDDGDPLVDIAQEARRAGVELRCSQQPHAAGRPRMFLLRAGIVEPLLAAAAELRGLDHTLLVEDAFRTRAMQRDIALSDAVLRQFGATLSRIEPHADAAMMVRWLAVVVAARPRGAGHMAGAAVDVSVLGPDGRALDRGGPYPTVSEKMPMASPFISEEAARNRRFISDVMLRHGFAALPVEFWHYSRDDAFDRAISNDPRPARYGPLDPLPAGGWAPADDQLAPLHDQQELAARLTRLLTAGTR
jgi:D-alanyl-D-alanine dipeptidase